MRPVSIVWFERLFLLSLLIGLLNAILSYDRTLAMVQSDPAFAQLGWGSGFVIVVTAISLLIPLLLWYFIARRASVIAKWLLVAITAIGVLMIGFEPGEGASLTNIGILATTILQVAAIVLLFRRDAVAWLGKKGADGTPA